MDSKKPFSSYGIVGIQLLLMALIALSPWDPLKPFEIQDRAIWFFGIPWVVGLLVLAWALINMGRNLTALPQPKTQGRLVIQGLYKYSRNPIYAGILLASFSWALMFGSALGFLLCLALVAILRRKVSLEEEHLRQRFGQSYKDYSAQVKRFFPWP